MKPALTNIKDEFIEPQNFVNWENLTRKSLLDGPDDVHILVDLPWITILKVLIEVEITSLFNKLSKTSLMNLL